MDNEAYTIGSECTLQERTVPTNLQYIAAKRRYVWVTNNSKQPQQLVDLDSSLIRRTLKFGGVTPRRTDLRTARGERPSQRKTASVPYTEGSAKYMLNSLQMRVSLARCVGPTIYDGTTRNRGSSPN